MVKGGMLSLLLAHFITPALLVDVTQIRVYPKQGSVSGVFHASVPGAYKFNVSAARDVCEHLGVVMADKKQIEQALRSGFETCRFGWINEQVAVIPRIQPNDSCGKGRVGIITWRAALGTLFDVFCFNSTDYEAWLNRVHENPSTTAPPTAHTSGAHPKLATMTRASQQFISSSLPLSLNDKPKSATFSNRSSITPVGLIALLTTGFVFLLLAVAAVCYFKKNSMGRWKKGQQKEIIETEVCVKTGTEDQADVKNTQYMTSNTNNVSVTIKQENGNGEPS